MRLWRDPRHTIEREADERYQRIRHAASVAAGKDIEAALESRTDSLTIERLIRKKTREVKTMSLLGKMKHLTESAQDFHKDTETVLDGIADKISAATKKRDVAVEKHHTYYDAIIAGVDESVEVIDRLSNGPLHGDGGN